MILTNKCKSFSLPVSTSITHGISKNQSLNSKIMNNLRDKASALEEIKYIHEHKIEKVIPKRIYNWKSYATHTHSNFFPSIIEKFEFIYDGENVDVIVHTKTQSHIAWLWHFRGRRGRFMINGLPSTIRVYGIHFTSEKLHRH